MRLKERHGFASMPRRRRRACVSSRSTRSKGRRELLPHLVAPLKAQRGRRQDQHALDAPPQQEFAQDQAGLDRLAEADVVGDQQVDARHAQCLEQRHELEVLDLHGAVEGARDRQRGRAARRRRDRGTAWPRSSARPGASASKSSAGIGSVRDGVGQRRGFEQRLPRLKLPEQSLLGRELVVLVVEVDQVQPARRRRRTARRRRRRRGGCAPWRTCRRGAGRARIDRGHDVVLAFVARFWGVRLVARVYNPRGRGRAGCTI